MASEGGHPFFTNGVQFPSAVSPAVTNVQNNLIVHIDRASRQLTHFHLCAARGLMRMQLPGELVLTFLKNCCHWPIQGLVGHHSWPVLVHRLCALRLSLDLCGLLCRDYGSQALCPLASR